VSADEATSDAGDPGDGYSARDAVPDEGEVGVNVDVFAKGDSGPEHTPPPADPRWGPYRECDTGDLLAPKPWDEDAVSAGIRFDDVTETLGLPASYGEAAAWGDVNGDSRPDLFVAHAYAAAEIPRSLGLQTRPEVFLNCGSRFVPAGVGDRDWGAVWHRSARVAAVVDLDHDGLADLVVGFDDQVVVAWAERDGTFDVRTVAEPARAPGYSETSVRTVVIVDFDLDGVLDIYVADLGGHNVLLFGEPGRRWVDRSAAYPELRSAGAVETYSAAFIPDPSVPMTGYLYLANHDAEDRIFYWGASGSVADVGARGIERSATMGVDYAFLGDGSRVAIATSDTAQFPIYGWERGPLENWSSRLEVGETLYNQWGVVLEDFDNDGDRDLLYAPGIPDLDPEMLSGWGGSTDANHLLIFEGRGADGERWVNVSEDAGPAFAAEVRTDLYALAASDFDSDGCLDFVVTPIERSSYRRRLDAFNAPIRVFRNRCGFEGAWIGLHVAADPGAVVRVTWRGPDGEANVRVADVKAAAGNGAGRDAERIHVGLGDAVAVERVDVRCRDGTVYRVEGDAIALRAWNDLRDHCARVPYRDVDPERRPE
jgi:hypothetical protein